MLAEYIVQAAKLHKQKDKWCFQSKIDHVLILYHHLKWIPFAGLARGTWF